MALNEADREDLLSEVSGLYPRGEWRVEGLPEAIVIGRRKHGGISIYFGGDPCFHFDAAGRLRRAFVDGLLLRSEGDTLAELRRTRSPAETILLRRDLTAEELETLLRGMQTEIAQFVAAARDRCATLSRYVAATVSDLDVLLEDLQRCAALRSLAPPIASRG